MLFKFFPREFDFYNLFEEQVDCAVQAAIKFKEIVSTPGLIEESAYQEILHLEGKAIPQAMPLLNSSTNLLSLLLTVKIFMPSQKSWMTLRT